MTSLADVTERLRRLIELSDRVIGSVREVVQGYRSLDHQLHGQLLAGGLSFFRGVFGEDHPYFTEFGEALSDTAPACAEKAKGVLLAAKDELDSGGLLRMRGLVAVEVFGNYLDAASHLLVENYKDAAAVMVGSTLEQHLRELASKNNIDTIVIKNGASVPKKADQLNADLAKEGVYNAIDLKLVTGWLGIRNSAAHGKYAEYTIEQVKNMLQGVIEFMVRCAVT